jgi:SAM-dependent methyltransferase
VVSNLSSLVVAAGPETGAGLACPLCGAKRPSPVLEAPDRFHGLTELYTLVRCPACSMVWLKDPPSFSSMGQHYTDDYYHALKQSAEHDTERWRSHLRFLLRFKREGSLLDLGCGSGSFLLAAKERFAPLYGAEMSTEDARRAGARTGASVFVGDILDAPFLPRSLDVITAFDVLEHMYKPREVVLRAWEWLRPGGVFYVALPNFGSWEAKTLRSHWFGLELPRHICHFSPMSLRQLFESAGFRKAWLGTPAATYLGYSAGYIVDTALSRMGFLRRPRSGRRQPPFLWRAVRKMNRITLLRLIGGLAAACSSGPILQAVFEKPVGAA